MITTLNTLLQQGQQQLAGSSESPRLDAEVLLGHILQVSRAHLYANPEREIAAVQVTEFEQLISDRHAGHPVAHLTGEREFWSLPFHVTPDVLSPRPETELLVEQALRHLPTDQPRELLDLACGSGAIAVALATERPRCNVTATDNSSAALEIARENAAANDCARIKFLHGIWFAPIGNQRFDVIVSNPPYVATGQPELTDPELAYEPPQALYSGIDGLDDIRLIIQAAPNYLVPGGQLLLEHGFDQAGTVTDLMLKAGFTEICTHQDLAGIPRVTQGCLGDNKY
jgi:release factor glutamine methyltransferase